MKILFIVMEENLKFASLLDCINSDAKLKLNID
jgi:hypothetical protein